MGKIVEILKRIYGLKIKDMNKGMICAKNDMIIVLIVAPHSDTEYRWMLRISTTAAFDRWANSAAIEEFYETGDEIAQYLENNVVEIYGQLLTYLTGEYYEMKQGKNGWIPICSGLLPEEREDVQVTYVGYHDGQPYCNAFAYRESNKWYWSMDDDDVRVEIIAWKRMCEPYRK